MNKIALLAVLVAASQLFAVVDGYSQAPNGKRYFCVDEIIGGLAYDEQLKRWRSTTFRPSGKFILSVVPFDQPGKSERGPRYQVGVADAGSDYSIPCVSFAHEDMLPRLSSYGEIRCHSNLQDYVFNFETMRYLRDYQHGYVDGRDNNDNTPSMAGGVCTVIE